MSQFFTIHSTNPQPRLIRQAADLVRNGAVIAYPTDSCYALGCHLGDKEAVARIRQIRGVDDKHHMTMVCRDLSELARYARVDNVQFRLLKNNTPGSYTFILEATKEVPKRLQHPKRSTIGMRIPDHPVALALLEELGEPLLSSTLILPTEEFAMNDAEQIRDLLQHQIDLVVDGGAVGLDPTTVIDLTKDAPVVVRVGKGDVSPFLIEK
ncbi:MAG: L-threonylcarbamoyladenylate synthase [Candidatus Nitrotoga sp.]|nr:L-threonylcarbamoyladenylate synthase [Candidatus Nitrotoga sp.]MDO9448291.1 L-threonylcarbamoyladenylate synthase [Candidatus Nitrotoga sp.]MDP3497324.1 L-threonylcarbamoyladenylate synthase [Candidatus Nitrotoga sp.]RFC41369.1 MAG: tRNA threonylcarbamoyl adenosine modification protein, Sua5/YciO/YrdC/YwlC family [Candidatus Nitrotoga sp. CP45]